MSSISQTPLMPPITTVESVGKITSTPKERRSANPYEQSCRRLFDKLWKIIRRYSVNVDSMSPEQVATFLTEEVNELKDLDALIALRMLEKSGEVLNENDDVKIGVYRLTHPSIKDLNDKLLGPNQTDEFIDELNQSITETLAKNSGQTLNTNFKRGIFIMNFTELVNGSGRRAEEVLSERIQEIKARAAEILRKHLEARIAIIEDKRRELIGEMEQSDYQPQAQILKLEKAIQTLKQLCSDLVEKRKEVNIAFGFNQLGRDPETSFASMRNAECAANISALNKEGNEVTMYSHEQLLAESIQGQQEFQQAATIVVDGVREVKAGWEPFCYVDEDGFARMQPHMIKIYRGLEKFKIGRKYRAMTSEQREDFREKIAVFGEYYDRINMVDVLKNFVEPNMAHYLSKVDSIAALLKECQRLLVKPGHLRSPLDVQHMKAYLDQTSRQLEISLKDDGDNIIQTTRAAVKALMDDGDKVIAFTDNIGFGAINQSSYEQLVLDLIRMLKISEEEWQAMAEGSQNRIQVVQTKFKENVGDSPAFYRTVLAIGDHGTTHLRTNEKRLQTLFGGTATINADGGDESMAIFRADQNPEMPSELRELQKDFLHFSNQYRVRIAAVYTPSTISPILDPAGFFAVDKVQRNQLLWIIFKLIVWGQDSHSVIKDLNARGLNRAEVKEEKICNSPQT